MNGIIAILNTLTPEKEQKFRQWISERNRRGDTKNIQLFNYLLAGEKDGLDKKIYEKQAKNAFHALCKRLQDNLINFVGSESLKAESSEELSIYKIVIASRVFLEQKEYGIGFKSLYKAEKLALAIDNYAVLNEIYSTKIQYAHANTKIILSEVIKDSISNMDAFNREFNLNLAYAEIRAKIQNLSDLSLVNEIVENTFVRYNVTIHTSLSYKSLYQLMHIISVSGKLQRNYYRVTPFILKTYKIVCDKQELAEKHLYYHIGILQIMAMTHFRNKEFKISMTYVDKMEREMFKANKVYFKRFSGDLSVLKALNYNFTVNPEKAIRILREDTSGQLELQLILLMCLFQQNKFEEAYQIIRTLHHSDSWYEKKAGWIWVLKKAIIEIILLIELDKLDLVLTRLQSFKIKFNKRLKEIDENRVLTFMEFVKRYYENPKLVVTDTFKLEVEAAFDWKETGEEDIYVMCFYAWLKAKMNEEGIYTTTLKLVSQF